MVDMNYLPGEPASEAPDFSRVEALPTAPLEVSMEPLTKKPNPVTERAINAVSSGTVKPKHEAQPADVESLRIESLQEVADIFKGKIVMERNTV